MHPKENYEFRENATNSFAKICQAVVGWACRGGRVGVSIVGSGTLTAMFTRWEKMQIESCSARKRVFWITSPDQNDKSNGFERLESYFCDHSSVLCLKWVFKKIQ
jgi:hypothetical protein